ncbi:MAG TPA: amino acid ABC transporter substrate-binding protein [Lachnospiraceae bacterium]|jgi:polar amino acid transport system substrate-binding protein|nr:amino acid ABC transporter substrate-binding protein [Lachnospiraceae bacterium]
MKKKGLTMILAIAMVVCTLVGCGNKGDNTFIVGFDANFPPYGYTDDNGDYVGFDLDLAAEVAKRNNWEIKLQPIDWDSKDMELSSGAIDCIWNGFTQSEDRLDKYTWSDPYVDNSQVFVVAADAGIASQADLAGKVVATQADSSALEALNSEESAELLASFGELLVVPDYNTAFMNLEAGAVDAIAMDIGVAQYQISSRDANFVILDDELVSEIYAVGFLLGNTELRDQVQKSLDEMMADGTFMQIAEKWELADCVIVK